MRPLKTTRERAAELGARITATLGARRSNRQRWSSQDLVDTPSPGFLVRFELLGAHTAQVTVATGSIVEVIDVVGHIIHR